VVARGNTRPAPCWLSTAIAPRSSRWPSHPTIATSVGTATTAGTPPLLALWGQVRIIFRLHGSLPVAGADQRHAVPGDIPRMRPASTGHKRSASMNTRASENTACRLGVQASTRGKLGPPRALAMMSATRTSNVGFASDSGRIAALRRTGALGQ
jgi:hypothetical protein